MFSIIGLIVSCFVILFVVAFFVLPPMILSGKISERERQQKGV